jgi:hypothetical protein
MAAQRPGSSQVWQAIDTYLRHAYDPAKPLPATVQARIDVLRSACGELVSSPAFEKDPAAPDGRFSLRLGNRRFPHMKLVVDCRTGERGFFRADAHDAHCRPKEGSREMAAYQDLVDYNRAVTAAIEAAWADEGLPTFKTFLREDLAKRAAAKGVATGGGS